MMAVEAGGIWTNKSNSLYQFKSELDQRTNTLMYKAQ